MLNQSGYLKHIFQELRMLQQFLKNSCCTNYYFSFNICATVSRFSISAFILSSVQLVDALFENIRKKKFFVEKDLHFAI
ncbi:hypothetical protein BpHYR1_048217 [Brachionus plicatilis]|uniref:Uncharacterized protein n=1 Tax=Brachionus plicatilis TaxID=10195 RepID=A0A3M7RY83_BRAPC|nr:hypothetical protein BpHYR1_048217 [Brachionus plicatilis]